MQRKGGATLGFCFEPKESQATFTFRSPTLRRRVMSRPSPSSEQGVADSINKGEKVPQRFLSDRNEFSFSLERSANATVRAAALSGEDWPYN